MIFLWPSLLGLLLPLKKLLLVSNHLAVSHILLNLSLFGIPECLLNSVFVDRYVGAASNDFATSTPDAAPHLLQSSS